jgi:PEP-CTERM motif
MKALKAFLAAVTFLLLIGPLNAQADIIYNWTGDCVTTCIGQATMLVVTTDAYIPGEVFGQNSPVQGTVLLRALYADSNLTFDFAQFFYIPGFGEFYVWPNMPPNTSGAFFGEILEGQNDFTSNRANVPGLWRIEGESIPGGGLGCPTPFGTCTYSATGIDGVWTRVPEPSTLVLLGVGLVGLVFVRRPTQSSLKIHG